ncbi:divalent-cation tolerance protein CutA, partial [archaeon]
HTYEVPEILAIPVADGYEGYISWMEGCLKLSQG